MTFKVGQRVYTFSPGVWVILGRSKQEGRYMIGNGEAKMNASAGNLWPAGGVL
jgi:hypothetical protein